VTLSRARLEGSLASVLTRAPEAEIRLVGTASSVVRGIELPANDIDILFRTRSGVDSWFGVLSAHLDVSDAPAWIAGANQYFARMHDGDVTIELSTVEIESDADTMECFGEGPWRYFDVVPCGARTVPAVATELRLITEVSRNRSDRYRPIVDHLRRVGCDAALIRRGLEHAGVAPDLALQIITALSPADGDSAESVRSRLRRSLGAAMKTHDKIAVTALRSALAAIENAEAAEPSDAPAIQHGVIAGGVVGLGAGEVPRRVLSGGEVAEILRARIAEWRAAADDYARSGHHDHATRLRAEADIVARFLADPDTQP